MSFIGLLVLLDEAISAADEKGLRKDWQKDMRGLLQAAVKQNKRAYTKRAAAPAAPKKADATKSPAKQMKDAQRGNTGSGGSEVEGPKGGNRGAGFSGSLGGPGGGGYGGGSSGGGGGGGGYAADIVITGAKGKEKSNANPLRDAMQASKSDRMDKVTKLLAKSARVGSKDAEKLHRMIQNKYSVRFANIASEEYVQDRNIGNMQIVTIDLSVSNWKGAFEFTVTLNMADGGDLKVSSEVIVDSEISSLDALGGAEEGDTVDFSLVDRLTDEKSNELASFFHGIVLNRDGVAFEMMLEEEAKTKSLARWAGQFAGMESPSIDPSKLPRGTYLLTDLEKQSNTATATVYLRTDATRAWYNVELVCRDSEGTIEIGNITDGNGKKASLRDLNTALQADLDALDRSTPPD